MTPTFKITGTPGTPVRLDTLAIDDWVTSKNQPNPIISGIWPAQIKAIGPDVVCVLGRDEYHETWKTNFLVHPLTRHVLADGTVEFRHVGAEAKDDIRPIGDLPVGTKFEYVDGHCDPCFIGKRSSIIDKFDDGGACVRSIFPNSGQPGTCGPDYPVRVISYPSDKRPTCNGTGVKPEPKPEPAYLERLPEAVRECIFSAVGWADNGRSEALARTIFENAEAIALASKGGAK